MIGWLCTLSTGGGSGGGSGGGKCRVTNGNGGGVFCRNRGHTGRTPIACLRAAILHPLTWRDSPDSRGADELTEELEGDKSHGEEKRQYCCGLLWVVGFNVLGDDVTMAGMRFIDLRFA